MIDPEAWVGLLLVTESSNRPHEWPALAWVVRNRVESEGFPDEYDSVVLQPRQFSFFNPFTGGTRGYDEIFDEVFDALCQRDGEAHTQDAVSQAYTCAAAILDADRWEAPFSHRVRHFWSPASMTGNTEGVRLFDSYGMTVPGPSWAKKMRCFRIPGNPRWVFAED